MANGDSAAQIITTEVILNGDSPAPTIVVEGVLQPVAPTTAEQKLARKNELKAREKRFGENTKSKKVQKTLLKQQYEDFTCSNSESLDQIHGRLQKLISQLEILGTTTQNLVFVSSSNADNTNEPISAAASVSAVNVKMLVSTLPNVDTLMRARRFLQRTGRNLEANGPTSMGFDMSKVECYNCHRKGYFARECRSLRDVRRNGVAKPQRRNVPVKTSTSNALVSQCDGLESVEARLLVYQQNESVFEEDIKLLKLEVQLRDNVLVTLRQNLKKAEQERDDLKLKSDDSLLPSPIYDRYQSGNGYHAVPPPYTGTFMPPKPDLVFNIVPNDIETDHPTFNVDLSLTKLDQDLSHTFRPSAPIIEDWVSDSEDESETKTP
uniref:CCHC-type domain-containing protein n=1 Tax=Tanacetum cinerariifolium TaxID=118510 RepID=A0A6L2JTX2_TANCI|nr:hypothetical protein [Tanacetum cinerariifolium]